MEQLTGILGTLLIFGAIIAIHEFGHFIVAKLSGMTVHEYSLGFGPAILKKQFGETLYALRAIPLGGYVRIAGMEPGEADDPNGYDKKPFIAKFATIAAGATMNFILAFVAITMLGMIIGYRLPGKEVMVDRVLPNTAASKVGLLPGDRVLAVEDLSGDELTINSARSVILASKGPVDITVERKGKVLMFSPTPQNTPMPERDGFFYKIGEQKAIGVVFSASSGPWKTLSFWDSVELGVTKVATIIVDAVAQFASLLTGRVPVDQLSGPVGIMQASYDLSKSSDITRTWFHNVTWSLALFSVLVGFFNLLPLPALDGGRLVFLLVEGIRRKPMDKEKEAMVHTIGMVVLLGFILLITFKDVWKIFGG